MSFRVQEFWETLQQVERREDDLIYREACARRRSLDEWLSYRVQQVTYCEQLLAAASAAAAKAAKA